MAVLTGIQGMNIGDGTGGKVALSIDKMVLRILSDSILTYAMATIRNPGQVKAGTVSYYRPEIVGAKDYGSGTSAFDNVNVGLVNINIDTRRNVKREYETFDVERLQESDYIIGMVSTGIAMAIQADLNGAFLDFLVKKFDDNTGDATLKTQKIVLNHVCEENPDMTPEEARKDYLKLQYAYNKIFQTFDKNKIGVPKAEILAFVAPNVDTGLTNAFWNQPNAIGEYVVNKTLALKQLGNLKYHVDNMLGINIPAGSSFNNDKDLDFSKNFGFLLHNEAVAMPINVEQIINVLNPDNGNPRFIAKYQYGIGILRPKLIYKIVSANTKSKSK